MNSRGHDDDALWSAYLDGTLDPETRARAEARLRTSAADREALESMRAADAQLRASAVPDPGAAYWRDFAARVDVRVQPRDPARIYEKLVGWFVQGERVRWMRAAGALAGLTLVTYIGMRGFRPAEVQMRSAPHQVQVSPPKPPAAPSPPPSAATGRKPVEIGPGPTPDPLSRGGAAPKAPSASALRDAPREAAEGKPAEERGPAGSPGVASKPHADQDDAASQQVEAEATQRSYEAVPPDRARSEEGSQALSKPPGAFAIEPQLGLDRTDKLADDQRALKVDLQDAGGRSATDSIASFLARSLRKDSAPSAFGMTTREAVKSLNQSKRANEAPKLPAAAPQSEVDRLLQLADIAERFETEPQFRPHLETIATRLAEYAREDARAAARARALMRKLAASSTTPGERATWEESLRQLPN